MTARAAIRATRTPPDAGGRVTGSGDDVGRSGAAEEEQA